MQGILFVTIICWVSEMARIVVSIVSEEFWVTVEDLSFVSSSVTVLVKYCIVLAIIVNCCWRDSTAAERESGGGVEACVTEESQVEIDSWSACSVVEFGRVEGFGFEFFFLPIEIFSEKEVIYVVIIV